MTIVWIPGSGMTQAVQALESADPPAHRMLATHKRRSWMIDRSTGSFDNRPSVFPTLGWPTAERLMHSTNGAYEETHAPAAQVDLEGWILAARGGDQSALARALMSIRDYLLLVANERMGATLKTKEGASDLVQETFLQAQQRISTYRGRSTNEWRSWLRSILIRELANRRRHFEATAKRTAGREVPVSEWSRVDAAARDETPSSELARREREAAVLEAISHLPEHYQEVVIWHQRDRLTFAEIGLRRGISAEAARKIWMRALGRLRKELDAFH
jgi:RNA polymerase sigma-70 factor (ECF subfamily)